MIQDLHDFELDKSIQTDICIIGSGAIGTAIALEFLHSPFNIVVLEAGGFEHEEQSQDAYLSELTGLAHRGVHEGRARVLGGTTTLWAGQALPYHPIDFEVRDWVQNSGWPLDRETLLPYYRRAEQVMQVEHVSYDPLDWPSKTVPPDYDTTKLLPIFSQFTLTPDFRDKYRETLTTAQKIRVICHANVVSLEANENGSAITEIRVKSLVGHNLCVSSRFVVVACGGIESARLLLISNSVEKNGVGNRNDVVGRYFQDHPHFAIDKIAPSDPHHFDRLFNVQANDKVRYAFKVAASPEWQRQHQLLGVVGEVYYPTEKNDPIAAAQRVMAILRGREKTAGLWSSLRTVAQKPTVVVKEAWSRYFASQAVSAGSVPPHFVVGVEQIPDPESRVTLSDQRDLLGLPRTRLHWRINEKEVQTIKAFVETVAAEWSRLEIAEMDISRVNEHARSETPIQKRMRDSYHHIGTTRMGTNPKVSVVDQDCRVHGYDNLYIAGSSVFPTGSFSNPTLTAIALAIRTADNIKSRLGSPAQVAGI
ncbi:MAG: GMC family oxidoreductase [Armatimonadaceae bacterium]